MFIIITIGNRIQTNLLAYENIPTMAILGSTYSHAMIFTTHNFIVDSHKYL